MGGQRFGREKHRKLSALISSEIITDKQWCTQAASITNVRMSFKPEKIVHLFRPVTIAAPLPEKVKNSDRDVITFRSGEELAFDDSPFQFAEE